MLLDAVPDLAWLRELELDQASAFDAVKWLAQTNYYNKEASAAQLCLWMLTGYNDGAVQRLAEATNLATHQT